ncbi:Protein OS-9 like protein [Penicillium brasilianum]|uniref:Endoplasmic reticulum lectin n=1 Tax=Penicillium brasilianum TaxID=104259 RepID=A0A1S9RUJ4_PENBI|nr:Protein OS-9 like protein [Penicillium brasilianum]
MGRSRWSLTPWLVLGCAASSAWAAKRPFNIHDDLLAYPQYQVLFPEEYILESQAEELLQTHASPETRDSHVERNDPQLYTGNDHTEHAAHTHEDAIHPTYTYEEMILDDRRLLCQIPRVGEDEINSTTGRTTQEADEQNELARATDRGLELLREMEGKCMYYFSGWWSYSFCYRNQIKQFHARPAGGGVPSYPPVEDPNTHSFVLGRFQEETSQEGKGDEKQKQKQKQTQTDVAELRTKGGSRYLVQHLRGGTKCDLTGRERKVEVQFHCHPQSTDQIGWIKELTTCSYLMVIYTPRLCDDVAFLPPQQDEVHNIECREILRPEDVPDWESVKEWYQAHQLADAAAAHSEVQIVGGIVVGGQKLVGMEGKKIEKGRVASAGEKKVEVVVKRENGEIQRPSKQVMKKYNLDPEGVEDMKKRLDQLAEGKDWTLEVVESDGMIEFQGAIEKDDDELDEKETGDSFSQKVADHHQDGDEPAPVAEVDDAAGADSASETTQNSKPRRQGSEDEDSVGSEETFKDEL